MSGLDPAALHGHLERIERDGYTIVEDAIEPELAGALVARTRAKSDLPEPLRLAHLFAHALVRGESRGRP